MSAITHHPDLAEAADTQPSASAHLLDQLALFGYSPNSDEPDPRPLPEAAALAGELTGLAEGIAAMLSDTRLEDDMPDILGSMVHVFHRKAERLNRALDANELAQRASQLEQDGSEIRSLDLERLIAEGVSLTERHNAFAFCRDHLADSFEAITGSSWRPHSGTIASHRHLTAAVIDSRDFIAARRRSETERLVPAGTRIAFAGGIECNDHVAIWAALDRVRTKHADMVLMHGGSPRGAERIAACWADNRKVPQIVFKPDWNRHRKAAPFKRNDTLLDILPAGVIVFPGSGITDNLADKARRLGIPVWRCREGG